MAPVSPGSMYRWQSSPCSRQASASVNPPASAPITAMSALALRLAFIARCWRSPSSGCRRGRLPVRFLPPAARRGFDRRGRSRGRPAPFGGRRCALRSGLHPHDCRAESTRPRDVSRRPSSRTTGEQLFRQRTPLLLVFGAVQVTGDSVHGGKRLWRVEVVGERFEHVDRECSQRCLRIVRCSALDIGGCAGRHRVDRDWHGPVRAGRKGPGELRSVLGGQQRVAQDFTGPGLSQLVDGDDVAE